MSIKNVFICSDEDIDPVPSLIAFLVYAGLAKVDSEIENDWSVKTSYHGLWEI